jgi:hypothetical protein
MNKVFYAIFAIIIFTCGVQAADATTVDLWDSFPDNQGDNGFRVYSHNQFTNTSTLLGDSGPYIFGSWPPAPYMGKYTDPWLVMHPRGQELGGTEGPVLEWTVPETNMYDISGAFDPWQDGYPFEVYVASNNGGLWSAIMNDTAQAFSLDNISLQAGDKLYFGMNLVADDLGRYYSANGTSLLRGEIEYGPISNVPEPITLSLLGIGVAGLFGFRKKI